MATTISLDRFPHRYMDEVCNQRKFDVLDELFAPEVLARIQQTVLPFIQAFSDWHGTVDDVIVQGDKVVNRWRGQGTHTGNQMGMPATGKAVTITGITIFRVAGNKIVEEWTQMDVFGLMQQLGVIPAQQ